MAGGIFAVRSFARIGLNAFFAVLALAVTAQYLFAVSCNVVKHDPPTEADKALLAADYAKAASLYGSELAKHPGDEGLTAGLVHALLRQQKLQGAADAVNGQLTARPNSPALLTLRGEVAIREGMPWAAADAANLSLKLDPCNPRTRLLVASLANISSLYATARRQILIAHQLDPEDPEIRSEWMGTLPLKQRISEVEAYLSAPTGDDAEDLRHVHLYLDHLKKLAAEPQKPCRLVSQTTATEIPFIKLMYEATHLRAFGLEVKLNNHAARLQIDTGAGGLVVSRSVAKRAGLQAFSQNEVGGIGDKGPKSGYTAYADSIRIGDLEFQNCSVQVLDSGDVVDVDGLIGMDVFSHFLVTLDYPMRKLALGPLPPRPGESAVPAPQLKTQTEDTDADEASGSAPSESQDKHETSDSTFASGAPPAAGMPAPHGPYDRYIAPEMKNYTEVYRVGHNLILPAQLNGQKIKLFILDTGSWATTISPDAAREVTKVHGDSSINVKGISGKVEKVYSASDVTFRFANLSQRAQGVVAFDTAHISKNTRMEISGFLGATTLNLLTIHIDYRDGLVKFDYDPDRGYKF
ncbi:MAG TPA: aspartyl protease family protein [Terracidiphilus sp.]|nr:aspartyl protease family protein [Terracidiphilus sp.]